MSETPQASYGSGSWTGSQAATTDAELDETGAMDDTMDDTSTGAGYDEPAAKPKPKTTKRKAAPRSSAASDARTKKMAARKAISTYRSLAELDEDELALVSALSGASTSDLVELAVDLSTGAGSSTGAASTLVRLADMEQMEALVEATILADSDEVTFKSLFALASSLGLEVPTRPSGAAVKSAMALVQGLSGLDSTTRARLQRGIDLLS